MCSPHWLISIWCNTHHSAIHVYSKISHCTQWVYAAFVTLSEQKNNSKEERQPCIIKQEFKCASGCRRQWVAGFRGRGPQVHQESHPTYVISSLLPSFPMWECRSDVEELLHLQRSWWCWISCNIFWILKNITCYHLFRVPGWLNKHSLGIGPI